VVFSHQRPHRIAVVAPITGPRAAWGQLLQGAIARIAPPSDEATVRWVVHDEAAVGRLVNVASGNRQSDLAIGGYAAVFGHLDQECLDRVLPHYATAGLPCFLPFILPERPPRPDLVLGWSSSLDSQAALLVRLLDSIGTRSVLLLRDGSHYGHRLAELLERAIPELARTHDAEALADYPSADVVVMCTLYHRAAQAAAALHAEGYRGRLVFPGDCAIAEFFGQGDMFHGSHLVRPAEGTAGRAEIAVRALQQAGEVLRPGATGPEWTDAVREASVIPLGPEGRPVADSWQLVRLDGSVS
jgi:ABC-type branched-subunit amino acid transport system substrate-binding protein